MATDTVIRIIQAKSRASLDKLIVDSTQPRSMALRLAEHFEALAAGNEQGTLEVYVGDTTGVKASGTVTIASGSGTVHIVINGVDFSRTWATDDTTTAAAFATAINASSNALVTGHVTATSALGVVTITAVEKGKAGNAITTSASGTGMTANQTRLTAGAGGGTTKVSYAVAG